MLAELWPGEAATYNLEDRIGQLPEKYEGVDIVDIVHMNPNWPINPNRPTEAQVLVNMQSLIPILMHNGISIRHISGPNLEQQIEDVAGKRIVIWGAVSDICCQIRQDLLRNAGANAWIDPQMVSPC